MSRPNLIYEFHLRVVERTPGGIVRLRRQARKDSVACPVGTQRRIAW